jgi:selenophosphate synthetase-related protein
LALNVRKQSGLRGFQGVTRRDKSRQVVTHGKVPTKGATFIGPGEPNVVIRIKYRAIIVLLLGIFSIYFIFS